MFKLLLVLIVSCIGSSNACSCGPIDKNAAYCNSKFVGTIKINEVGQRCGTGNTCYVLQDVKQIRGDKMTPILLRTADNSAACGVSLLKGNTYFVATDPVAIFYLGLYQCQFYEDWTGLSSSEIEAKKEALSEISC